ncbi:hypothetical protein EXIGLDRAFT_837037 [Exidia glandulosa HHB12029]|uniref:Ricin B lectin domain-containing protein n=1 Tax=Exidia glandulosa HHB12029 TaxID=1314781 RepID=A0A165H7G6_EXIGL|nr:hypothetical protein EXIGLDRAFT_837037 [Exidia glandulosa HHB12029]
MFATGVTALSLFAATVAAAAVSSDATSTKPCFTVKSGYFSGFTNETIHFGLDEHHRLVKADTGVVKQFKINFQACPALGGYYPNVPSYLGRIVLQTSSFVSSNTCLTIQSPISDDGPWTAQAQKCGDATKPSAAQKWVYGSDFGGTIFWAGSKECGNSDLGAGYESHTGNDSQPVITTGTHLIQLRCEPTKSYDLESFSLS